MAYQDSNQTGMKFEAVRPGGLIPPWIVGNSAQNSFAIDFRHGRYGMNPPRQMSSSVMGLGSGSFASITTRMTVHLGGGVVDLV